MLLQVQPHTGAVPEVQAGELPVLLREQVPERVRELRLPSADFRNRRRRLNLQDFLYHKWDKTYSLSAFLREHARTRCIKQIIHYNVSDFAKKYQIFSIREMKTLTSVFALKTIMYVYPSFVHVMAS